jgi:hypothetical protein
MSKDALLAAALCLGAVSARAQARPALSAARDQLTRMAETDYSGPAETMAAKASLAADGAADRPGAVVVAPGVAQPAGPATGRGPASSSAAQEPPPPAGANPFGRSEDGPWVAGPEGFLTVEKFPLSLIRKNVAAKVAGAILFVIGLVAAVPWMAYRAVVGLTWR